MTTTSTNSYSTAKVHRWPRLLKPSSDLAQGTGSRFPTNYTTNFLGAADTRDSLPVDIKIYKLTTVAIHHGDRNGRNAHRHHLRVGSSRRRGICLILQHDRLEKQVRTGNQVTQKKKGRQEEESDKPSVIVALKSLRPGWAHRPKWRRTDFVVVDP